MKLSRLGLSCAILCFWCSPSGAAAARLRRQPFQTWFGIASAPGHYEHRRAVRDTWLLDPWPRSSQACFVIGRSDNDSLDAAVLREKERFHDILLVNVTDTYRNLAHKVAYLLRAGAESGADWVVKVDDDVVPRLASISDSFQRAGLGGSALRYAGTFWTDNVVNRDPNDAKYYVPLSAYSGFTFPPFANGPLYAISHGLAKLIALDRFQEFWGHPIPLEDANVGVAVSLVGRLRRVEYVDLELGINHNGKILVAGCEAGVWSQYYHDIPPQEMRCMWKRMQQGLDACCPSWCNGSTKCGVDVMARLEAALSNHHRQPKGANRNTTSDAT